MQYIEEVVKNIVKADDYLKGLFFKLAPLYKGEHGKNQGVVVPLFTSLHSTSESILILLLNQAIFDADVLLRTVMEGTIKYCYLMTGTESEKEEKYAEYKEMLTDIDKLSDHHKSVEAVDILKEFSMNSTKPFEISILSDEELKTLSEKYPRKERDALKRKWSYQSLLRSLAREYPEYKAQLGTISTYSLASHFCHYDWTGLSSRNDHIMNSVKPDAIIFDVMHCNRILSNVLGMELFRIAEYMRGNGFFPQDVIELYSEVYDFVISLDRYSNELLEKAL